MDKLNGIWRPSTETLEIIHLSDLLIYGLCGSRNYRKIGRRATNVKNGNAGPKLHWRLWEKGRFPALADELYFLADNKGHDGD